MRRFVPVPYDALGLCGNDRERLCVLRLYREAHGFKWKPMRLAVREFASWSDLRLADAVELLRSLEEAGLLRRDESARRGASTIEVFDPAAASGTQTGRSLERRSEHYDEPPDEPDERSAERRSERRSEHLTRGEEDTPAVEPNPNRTRTNDPTPQPPASKAVGIQFDEDQVTALTPAVQALGGHDIERLARGETDPAYRQRALAVLQHQRKANQYVGSLRKRSVGPSLVEAARRVIADREAIEAPVEVEAAEARAGPDPPHVAIA